jgi:hypothetical protein
MCFKLPCFTVHGLQVHVLQIRVSQVHVFQMHVYTFSLDICLRSMIPNASALSFRDVQDEQVELCSIARRRGFSF